MNLAIIPARGGSKRIPKKNIKLFNGYPIMYYAIKAAKESKLFDKIIVSTDDLKIKEIALSYGVEVPFIRPNNLSDDLTPTIPVVQHAINFFDLRNEIFKFVCTIYPCVPLINSKDLYNSFALLKDDINKYCFPIAEYSSPIQRALKLGKENQTSSFYPEFENERTQDCVQTYFDAGLFYWGKRQLWLDNYNIHQNGIGYKIPSWRAIDIDNLEDWEKAEILYKYIYSKN